MSSPSFRPLSAAAEQAVPSELAQWFSASRRALPWRAHRDPYKIWVSEVMLQQTTVAAVVPYYERFLKQFPDVKTLARAPEEKVLAAWAGLGYYSRARRLRQAAQEILKNGSFPASHKELLKLPGFGPYTARAVSSLAFGEKVGVVDGNVIRVLTRLSGFPHPWWGSKVQRSLQAQADLLAQSTDPYVFNQAIMELGATVCTPQKPTCTVCPVIEHCQAHQRKQVASIPLARPRPAKKIWIWQPSLHVREAKVALVVNNYAPFLKGQWMLPGTARPSQKPPQEFAFKHTITNYDIFVLPRQGSASGPKGSCEWVPLAKVSEKTPSSLIKKALSHYKLIETSS